MKAKIKIEVQATYWVEVDAETYVEALNKAKAVDTESLKPAASSRHETVLALQGPFRAQKLPHSVNTIVVSAPTGGRFGHRDVGAIHRAARRAGIDVAESWNGVGCNSLSMRAVEEIGHDEVEELNDRIQNLKPDYRESLQHTPWANRQNPF